MVIGGGGEKKTLRVVAKHADIWNTFGSLETVERKVRILGEHCEAVGRDPAAIQLTVGAQVIVRDSAAEARAIHEAQLAHNLVTPENTIIDPVSTWTGTVNDIVDRIGAYRALGISGLIVEMPAPFDDETLRRLAEDVRPRLG